MTHSFVNRHQSPLALDEIALKSPTPRDIPTAAAEVVQAA